MGTREHSVALERELSSHAYTKDGVPVPVVLGVVVVDFVRLLISPQNHLVGPRMEYACPSGLLDNEELASHLPFMALPDGSHLVRHAPYTSRERTTATSTSTARPCIRLPFLAFRVIARSWHTSLLTSLLT